MKHTISVLVENKPGVLARIASLFSARGYNIGSLAVGETEQPDISRMTIVVKGDERILEQVMKQLNKLIDIIKVTDFLDTRYLERDLSLIKVSASKKTKSEILEIVKVFRARVIDMGIDSIIIEMTGTEEKMEALIENLKPFGIVEMVRTGTVAMSRGKKK